MKKISYVVEAPERLYRTIKERFRTQTREYRHQIAIVAIIKNEGAYIKEWVTYHTMIGVSHFYLFDNGSTDSTKAELVHYIESGIVDFIPFEGRNRQLPAYNYALKHYGNDCRYMAFIDADEFLFVMNKAQRLEDIIDELLNVPAKKSVGGLAVNWRMFGSSGLEHRPEGGVLENYLYRAAEDGKGNNCIKTIVNPRKVYKYKQPHFPTYLYGYYSIDENGNKVKGWSHPVEQINKIRINHYFTKSKEEWVERRSFGKADKSDEKRTIEEFYAHDNNEIFDDSMLYYVQQMETQLK
ncbi:glycosyltransferase family 92 protein [Parablautia sp. Marseille-Q6255]|uniref:glycosyltransferase family 92 protein n=1 Tax=Parablautia sp. Marseille-Q6255 TaxID=3039593 RepID=UPI0024BC346D|nr:glycosyltransferase family 92 protein [Parablautia sp. Marseille-Q6255]